MSSRRLFHSVLDLGLNLLEGKVLRKDRERKKRRKKEKRSTRLSLHCISLSWVGLQMDDSYERETQERTTMMEVETGRQ